jgi:uncharacterized protein YlxP (DUF503 family)
MIIGVCTIQLQVPASGSLKDKRRAIKSFTARVRNEFNVSIAEVDHQDSWQLTTLAVACVATDAEYAHGLLQRVVRSLENGRYELVLLDYEIELL